jgi:hypothetical protein
MAALLQNALVTSTLLSEPDFIASASDVASYCSVIVSSSGVRSPQVLGICSTLFKLDGMFGRRYSGGTRDHCSSFLRLDIDCQVDGMVTTESSENPRG